MDDFTILKPGQRLRAIRKKIRIDPGGFSGGEKYVKKTIYPCLKMGKDL